MSRRRAISDLREVFNWLRKDKGVRKIIKVIVVDYGTSHSDEVIEEALSGFQVEQWDWKKVDLCTDVIARCSDRIKKLSLYASGNSAVLKGWASPDGLADPRKFPQLEEIHLFIRLGQASEARRKANVKAFEERVGAIRVSHTRKVKVKTWYDDAKTSFAADFTNNQGEVPRDVSWITTMNQFAMHVTDGPRERNRADPIKIAIIDDGLDASLDFSGRIAGGKSFCPYSTTSKDLMNAYYVPTGRHGTQMAELILKVCPRSQLYVARVDERPSRLDMTRQINPASVVDAIEWAIECDVDIISMSWTIEATKHNEKDIDDLVEKIKEAAARNIVMFCANSDQGGLARGDCYPQGGDVIRIGAATAQGKACSWVTEKQYDYLLPGQNIPFKVPASPDGSGGHDGTGPIATASTTTSNGTTSYESGSSFATALASGLGALLLYCERLLKSPSGKSFKNRENMFKAFRTLSALGPQGIFPRVDVFFSSSAFTSRVEQVTKAHYVSIMAPRTPGGGGGLDPASTAAAAAALRQNTGGGTSVGGGGGGAPEPRPLTNVSWSDEHSLEALRQLIDRIKNPGDLFDL